MSYFTQSAITLQCCLHFHWIHLLRVSGFHGASLCLAVCWDEDFEENRWERLAVGIFFKFLSLFESAYNQHVFGFASGNRFFHVWIDFQEFPFFQRGAWAEISANLPSLQHKHWKTMWRHVFSLMNFGSKKGFAWYSNCVFSLGILHIGGDPFSMVLISIIFCSRQSYQPTSLMSPIPQVSQTTKPKVNFCVSLTLLVSRTCTNGSSDMYKMVGILPGVTHTTSSQALPPPLTAWILRKWRCLCFLEVLLICP